MLGGFHWVWFNPAQGKKNLLRGEARQTEKTHEVSLAAHPPFEMATHKFQRVMVRRRHAEHQTLQSVHFVHVVRHLCKTNQQTC